jgi:hypothetical protein
MWGRTMPPLALKIMPPLVQLNLLGAFLLVIQALVYWLFLANRDKQNWRFIAFFAFWSLANFFNLVDWALWQPQEDFNRDLRFDLALDTLENFSFAFAAYSLLCNNEFRWTARNLINAGLITLIAVLVMVLSALFVIDESPFLKALYISPDMLMAAGIFIAIAIGFFRSHEIGAFRWPLILIFTTYAYVQLPIYVRWIAGDSLFKPDEVEILRIILMLGKFALVLAFIVVAVSYVWNRLLQPVRLRVQHALRLENWLDPKVLLQLLAWAVARAYGAITYLLPVIARYLGW